MPITTFSHSALSTYRRCRYRYYLSYIMNYGTEASKGQMRGTLGHAALGAWYTNGGKDLDAIKVAYEMANVMEIETGIDLSQDWEDLQLVLYRYFNWARANDYFECVAVEQEFDIEIDGMHLKGFIDEIVKFQGYLWIMENKFNKNASVEHVDLDMQISIYLLAARKLGYDPYGVIYNVVRMGEKGKAVTDPVLRTLCYRNKEGLATIERELANQMREVTKFILEPEGRIIYRNPTKDCKWDCSFYTVCQCINDTGEAESALSRFKIIERNKDKNVPDEPVSDES